MPVFPNQQELDAEGLIRRTMSGSYVPKTGPLADYIVERLGDLHRRHADDTGRMTLVYVTELYWAERL